MHYPFTTEQLLELIEFVARAIMLQAHPSGDDSIIGRQASRGLASLTQNCLLTHWGSLFPSEPFTPAGPARFISAAYPLVKMYQFLKKYMSLIQFQKILSSYQLLALQTTSCQVGGTEAAGIPALAGALYCVPVLKAGGPQSIGRTGNK